MVCECHLATDPAIQSIWTCLSNYDFKNATFIAERVFAENPNEITLYILATCLYRSNLPKQAKLLLLRHDNNSPKCKYLLAKCYMDFGNLVEAEIVLIGPNQELSTVVDVTQFYKDLSPYVLMILGEIFYRTERRKMSVACYKKCLELNPFLWSPYEELINMSENLEPNDIFILPKENNFNNTSCLKVLSNRINIGEINHPNCPSRKRNDIHDSQEDLSVSRENVNPQYDEKNFDSMEMDEDRIQTNAFSNRSAWASRPIEIADNISSFCGNDSKSVISNSESTNKLPLFGNVQLNASLYANAPAFHAHENENQDKRSVSSILSQNTANSGKKVRSNSNTNKKYPISNFRCNDTSTPLNTIRSDKQMMFSPTSSSSMVLKTPVSKDAFQNHPQNHLLTSPPGSMSCSNTGTGGSVSGLLSAQLTCDFSPIISAHNSTATSTITTANNSNNSTSTSSTTSSPSLSGPRTRSQAAKIAAQQKMSQSKRVLIKPLINNNEDLSLTTSINAIRSIADQPLINNNNSGSHPSEYNCFRIINSTSSNNNINNGIHHNNANNTNTIHTISTSSTATSNNPTSTTTSNNEYTRVKSANNYLNLIQNFAKCYKLLKQSQFNDAIRFIKTLPKHHIETALVSNWLAKSHFEMMEISKAFDILFKSRKIEPWQLHCVVLYSSILWKMNKETLLLNLSNEMMEFDRESAEIWCVYGNCMSLHRDSDAAIRFLQRAIQINPRLPNAYILLGHEYYMEDDIDKALMCFRRALELDKSDHKPLYGIGMVYQKQEKYHEAARLMKDGLKLNPDSLYLLTNLAVIYTKLHQQSTIESTSNTFNILGFNGLKAALELIEKACNLYGKEPICIYHRATILYQMGKFNEALEDLKHLSSINPKEARVLMLMSLIYKQLDNPTLSMMYSSRATELDPKCNNESLLLDRSLTNQMNAISTITNQTPPTISNNSNTTNNSINTIATTPLQQLQSTSSTLHLDDRSATLLTSQTLASALPPPPPPSSQPPASSESTTNIDSNNIQIDLTRNNMDFLDYHHHNTDRRL